MRMRSAAAGMSGLKLRGPQQPRFWVNGVETRTSRSESPEPSKKVLYLAPQARAEPQAERAKESLHDHYQNHLKTVVFLAKSCNSHKLSRTLPL